MKAPASQDMSKLKTPAFGLPQYFALCNFYMNLSILCQSQFLPPSNSSESLDVTLNNVLQRIRESRGLGHF